MAELPPLIWCLCPTYGRPQLLKNAIACFHSQSYPAERRRLLIADDGNQLKPQQCENVSVITFSDRFNTLPDKYNWMAEAALRGGAEIIAIWEDDDIYLPHHLELHRTALVGSPYSKPSRIFSTAGGSLHEEETKNLFFPSIAFTTAAYRAVGGLPRTRRADFDQQFMRILDNACGRADPCSFGPLSYVYRWDEGTHVHGSALMRSDDDEDWWERCRRTDLQPAWDWTVESVFDARTLEIIHACCPGALGSN